MKTCSHCGLPKRIPDDFYKNCSKPDGFSTHCKSCHNNTMAKYRAKPGVKEREQATQARWREANPEKHAAIVARYNGSDAAREAAARYRKANPEKWSETMKRYRTSEKGKLAKTRYVSTHRAEVSARKAVAHAVKMGKIEKPDACTACGAFGRVEAHHHRGYDAEYSLDVIWLCDGCHTEADR